MSKVFDYISGKVEGREAELEAALEHLMAHCVPEPEYERQKADNARLLEALEQLVKDIRAGFPRDKGFDMALEALAEQDK